MSDHDNGWIRLCDVESIPQQGAEEFVVEGNVVAVFRDHDRWYGLDAMCAHQGGPIAKGTVANGCVTCPWHGWQYELATGKQTIHNQKLLETYPLKEQDGGLWIQLIDPRSTN